MGMNEIPLHLYIAGPMTGHIDWNFPAFNAAAEDLIGRGYTVFNPACHGAPPAWKFEDYMQRDLAEVCKADMLVMLPGWQYSKGAALEAFVAQWCGIPCVTYPRMQPIECDPVFAGAMNVWEIMRLGLQKHAPDSWRTEPDDNHIGKACRHAITHQLIRDGNQKPSEDDHLRLFQCRATLALAQRG